MTKTMTITFAPDGQAKVETHGFDGQSCQDASKFLETALGQKTAEQFKPEFFTSNTHSQQLEVRQ